MRRFHFAVFAALMTSTAQVQAQSLLRAIRKPEKAVPVINRTPSGTWLLELRRDGQPATQLPVLNLITSAADGTQNTHHGLWVRVGDQKFLQTMFVFSFN